MQNNLNEKTTIPIKSAYICMSAVLLLHIWLMSQLHLIDLRLSRIEIIMKLKPFQESVSITEQKESKLLN